MELLSDGTRRILARWGGRPRQIAAAVCAVAAAVLAVTGTGGSRPEDGVPVVVAARDVPAGAVLTGADLAVAHWPERIRPAGAVDSIERLAGARAGAAIGSGEAVTSTRLLDGPGGRLAAGTVATVIRAGPAVALVQPGDRVDVYAAPGALDLAPLADGSGPPAASLVADDVLVLSVAPAARSGTASAADPDGDVVLQVDASTAARLAGAGGSRLTVVVRPHG